MRKLAILLVLSLLLASCASNNPDDTASPSDAVLEDVAEKLLLEIGDYLEFGSYEDQPILWQVINIDANGNPLLWSDKVLTFKAFDSAESGKSFYTNDGTLLFDIEKDDFVPGFKRMDDKIKREAFGSCRWDNSNIKEWLNSDKELVDFTTQPPNEDSIYMGIGAYESEAGFLNGFTDTEQSMILTVQNKTLLTELDLEHADGGEEIHDYEWGVWPSLANNNYENSYYEYTEDRVFLLSINELWSFVEENGLSLKKKATESALDNNKLSGHYLEGEYSDYVLRTPYPTRSHSLRNVDYDGGVSSWHAYFGGLGIIPALYLDGGMLYLNQGDGSLSNPYLL